MILVRVTSSNLGQVSSDCDSSGASPHAFLKFLIRRYLYQYKAYFVGSWIKKRRMVVCGADTGLQRPQCYSQFCLEFQSPFLYKFQAQSCSPMSSGFTVLLSHVLQICDLIYVLEATLNLNIVLYILNKVG